MNRYLSKRSSVCVKTIRTCINDPGCDLRVQEALKWKLGWLGRYFFVCGVLIIENKSEAHRLCPNPQARRTARTLGGRRLQFNPRAPPGFKAWPGAYRLRVFRPFFDFQLRFAIPDNPYMGIGEKGMQAFYCFVESMRNPQKDPLIFHFSGGPGVSSLSTILAETGPLAINTDDLTLTLNPNALTQVADIVFVDIPVGTGFSYSETQEGWVSSDTIQAANYKDFVKKVMSAEINQPSTFK
ncbi:hypothetical protein E3N88_00865 [Mikania micrantha]|uniref:Uncharacterized protein n=1 Tax=Mikania micrantha TaxID=192012 RepID=A0A5N6PZD2_9ASTR|nr:hypothetical protein E3N88_00865 [Mikania micrantha]